MRVATVLISMSVIGQSARAQWNYPFWPLGEATSGVQAQAQGMADLIRARGQYEQDHVAAVAAMNAENQLQIQRRQEQFAAYDALRQQRLAETRQRNVDTQEQRHARAASILPQPLTMEEFDPQTGRIAWPASLMQKMFEPSRVKVDGLFQDWARARQSAQTIDLTPIVQAVGAMRNQLRDQIRAMETMTYLQARRFLDSLEVSARS